MKERTVSLGVAGSSKNSMNYKKNIQTKLKCPIFSIYHPFQVLKYYKLVGFRVLVTESGHPPPPRFRTVGLTDTIFRFPFYRATHLCKRGLRMLCLFCISVRLSVCLSVCPPVCHATADCTKMSRAKPVSSYHVRPQSGHTPAATTARRTYKRRGFLLAM